MLRLRPTLRVVAAGGGGGMRTELPKRLCGEEFGARELATIRSIVARSPGANRRAIAREVCERLGWINAAGRLKEMGGRVALLRLARAGWIELPPPQNRNNGNGRWPHQRHASLAAVDATLVEGTVGELGPVSLDGLATREESHLWNTLVARHHELGYTPLAGAQLRYLIRLSGQVVGCLGFGAAAWKVACRDELIGWDRWTREAHLGRVVNNTRFLLLPWVRVKNLASHVLSKAARRVVVDFHARYGIRPVLLETFVDPERHRGTCYRAANWRWVGRTRGRGKLDRRHEHRLPPKDVYLLALRADFRRALGVVAR